jgi:hypothetical protein
LAEAGAGGLAALACATGRAMGRCAMPALGKHTLTAIIAKRIKSRTDNPLTPRLDPPPEKQIRKPAGFS